MPNITQAVKSVTTRCALVTVMGVLAGDAVIASTGEDSPLLAWRERISTTDVNSDAQAQRIIEIVDSEDGTLGVILFGEGKRTTSDSTRRGPR